MHIAITQKHIDYFMKTLVTSLNEILGDEQR
jgi:hypothetical protein